MPKIDIAFHVHGSDTVAVVREGNAMADFLIQGHPDDRAAALLARAKALENIAGHNQRKGHLLRRAAAQLRDEAEPDGPSPIPMILHCPTCGTQHVDAPSGDWTNPPHRSHLCDWCGTVWRPADVPTEGVASIATRGAADSWPPASSGS